VARLSTDILLVEDNEFDIEITLRALREHGITEKVEVARDGEEALTFLARGRGDGEGHMPQFPRLILLDLKLPKIDGLEVLRRLKEKPETRVIPVVVLTSSKEYEDMSRSYLAGVNSYVQKPVNFERFRKIVGDLGLYWLAVNQLPPVSTPVAQEAPRSKTPNP